MVSKNKNYGRHDIEIAAGGLVWDIQVPKRLLAVVHRPKYNDWALPKGHPEKDETIEETALREAMEETGFKVALNDLAGSYVYMNQGRLKVVVIWNMTKLDQLYHAPASKNEIDRVLWLSPDKALTKLTYKGERDLVALFLTTEDL